MAWEASDEDGYEPLCEWLAVVIQLGILLFAVLRPYKSLFSVEFCTAEFENTFGLRGVRFLEHNGIAVYVITCNSTKSRMKGVMETWGPKLRNHPAVSYFSFITGSYENVFDIPYPIIKTSSDYDRFKRPANVSAELYSSWDLAPKDAFIMRHCAEQTNSSWCLRILDDTYVNMPAFENFVVWLSEQGNPRENPMAFGNCLNWWDHWLLQGGSGWIFSRKAGEMFIESEDEWITSMKTFEDHHVVQFFDKIGWTSRQASCPYFSGHFLEQDQFDSWKWSPTPNLYMPCPTRIQSESHCANNRLIPFRSVAFLHSCQAKLTQYQWERWLSEVPEDTMFYNHLVSFTLCIGPNSTTTHFV